MHANRPPTPAARPAGPTPTRPTPAVRAEVPPHHRPDADRPRDDRPTPDAHPDAHPDTPRDGSDAPATGVAPQADLAEGEFRRRLTDLLAELGTLPAAERERIERLADDARRRDEQMRSTVSGLQDSLDYLRLSIKYLVFDLEATRRENAYLRKMVDEAAGDD